MLVMTGLGNEMFHKIHLIKFCPLFTYLKQSSFSFSKLAKLLGHNHGGSAIFLDIHFSVFLVVLARYYFLV